MKKDIPPGFESIGMFLGYCECHSEEPGALFHISYVNKLYELAGIPYHNTQDSSTNERIPIYPMEMTRIMNIIKRRENSIEGEFERVDDEEKPKKPKDKVVSLDNYR